MFTRIAAILMLAAVASAQTTIVGNGTTSGGFAMSASNPLVTITISGSASQNVGVASTYTALGTFADGSTADLTAIAVWASSNPVVASISAAPTPQTVTCNKGNTVNLTAVSAGVTGTFSLACSKVLTTAVVSPSAPSALVGVTTNFTVNCTYNDGTSGDCTSSAAWSSGTPAVASVTDTGAVPQPALCLTAGSSVITATVGVGLFPSSTLTCTGGGSTPAITTTSLPNATANAFYSAAPVATGGTPPYTWTVPSPSTPPAGSVDMLTFAVPPLPTRNTQYLTGSALYKAFHLDGGMFWWLKNSTGNPWDGNLYDGNRLYLWFTEDGDAADNAACVAAGYPSCFEDPFASKKFVSPVPLMPRYFALGGADVTINSPGTNNIIRTTNCGADSQPQIGIGNIVTVTHDAGIINYGGGVGAVETIVVNYYWGLASVTPPYQSGTRERFYLTPTYGQVEWDTATWNGSAYVVGGGPGQNLTTNIVNTGTPPTPNFACKVPTLPLAGLPSGVTSTASPQLNMSDTAGTISGTPTTATTYPFTVQVQDATGATASKLLSIQVNPAAGIGVDAYCGPGNVPNFGTSDGPATLPQSCFYTNPSATPSGTGIVTGADLSNNGTGYTTASVSFSGGGGSGATATATVLHGNVIGINMTNGGSGYTSAPTVTVSGNGTGAVGCCATVSTPVVGPYSDALSFQTALNNAVCGQTIEGAAGVILQGTFTLPALVCPQTEYVLVQVHGAAANLPPYGTRVSPCQAGVISRPGYPSFNCGATNNVMLTLQSTGNDAGGTGIVLNFTGPTSSWRFRGIRFARTAGTGFIARLINLPTSIGVNHIIFDQDWCDGSLTTTDDNTRCMDISYTSYFAVIDSDLTEFHCQLGGSCTDGQAIADGANNSGTPSTVHKIVNNFCTASGEGCYLSGGNTANTVPTDIEIRLNYPFVPMTWNPLCTVATCGVNWLGGTAYGVKNLLEFKNGNRALIENNFLQNTWVGLDQAGVMMLLTPKSQGGLCPLCQDNNITVRYNYGTTGNYGMQIATFPSDVGVNRWASGGHFFSIHDNVFDNLGYANCYHCSTNVGNGVDTFSTNPDNTALVPPGSQFHDVTIVHNDYIAASGAPMKAGVLGISGVTAAAGAQMYNYNWKNNLTLFQTGGSATGINNSAGFCGQSGSVSCNCSPNNTPASAQLNACFASASYNVSGNALVNASASIWPGTNCTAETSLANIFTNYNGGVMIPNGNFVIKSTSPCHNSANDGLDPGANIPALLSGIAGVNTWVAWNPAPPSWVQVAIPASIVNLNDLAIVPGTQTAYVVDRATGGTTWKTSNFSSSTPTWTQCTDTGLGSLQRKNISWDAHNSQLIIATNIGGSPQNPNVQFWRSPNCASWTLITPPFNTTWFSTAYSGTAYSPGGTMVNGGFYANPGTSSGAWYSTDGGATTHASVSSYTVGAGTAALAASLYWNPVTSTFWTGSESHGMFRGPDPPVTFTQESSADTQLGGTFGSGDIYGITSDLSGCMYAGQIDGVYYSCGPFTGSSTTWTRILNGSSGWGTRTLFTDPAGNVYVTHNKQTAIPAPVYYMPVGTNKATCSQTLSASNSCFVTFSVGLTNFWEGFHIYWNTFDSCKYMVLELGSTNAGQIWKYC